MKKLVFLLLILSGLIQSEAQRLVTPGNHITKQRWPARWIIPKESAYQYGVFHFRKSFNLTTKPGQFVIHLSADNRYRLFVNGTYVTEGPQISDAHHWRFESLDIASLLKEGKNVVAVQVVNYAEAAPVYVMGKRTALIVQGDDESASVLNTNASWKYVANKSISPIVFRPGEEAVSRQYYAAGPMEKVDASLYPWGWETPNYDDSNWSEPLATETGAPFGVTGYGDATWDLLPRSIPLNQYISQQPGVIRRSEGLKSQPVKFPVQIPANTTCSILIDQQQLTNAFPQLRVSGGKSSEIKITYAEALFEDIKDKGHRDSIAGKSIHGVYDVFIADGGAARTFTSLAYRTFRYLQLDIKTESQTLTIDNLASWFTGYPFEKKASFTASDPSLSKVFDIGWHTARLCAYETYMDCPYWERLQYIGDTRIQALVSYYVSGDDRLARNALEQFNWSLGYDGLTYSRYPSSLPQYIPNYSLVWVTMIHDFFMYRNDPEYVKTFLPGMQRVLEHFQQYVTDDYMMKEQPYWDFFDHTFATHKIVEESLFKKLTTNSLFYAYTLSMAAEIFSYYKEDHLAQKYAALSEQLKASVKKQTYDSKRRLYADTPDKKHFSMHSNIMAVLCGLVPRDEQKFFLKRITEAKDITPTTLYFDFYLARAMNQAEVGDQYMDLLFKWKKLLSQGLTTFPEGVDRSECHAWSASPNFEMLATFAGIQPFVPGFKKVLIKPQLQKLDRVKGTIPHWAGNLEVTFEKKGTTLTGVVTLPKDITGRLEWNGKVIELKSGENKINVM
ncbi:MAG: alpha-L-rhamnosidase N-terminal domain-containing protein [Cyclobacteriaceae bacterium]|nr:alpha-L-rhamnosidase N-terminal domain-containing protein [Cyclobacteriaceae bacterium]